MRYEKAPILEAVLAFGWQDAKSVEELLEVLSLPEFEHFEEPKERLQIGASINVDAGEFSHQQVHMGWQSKLRDGSEIVFLETNQFVYIEPAPYDRWDHFHSRATSLLDAVVSKLGVESLERIGLRFVNRIDVPLSENEAIDKSDFININFNGPREDIGVIEEFQMRVVKPTEKKGIHYGLVVATTAPPMPGFTSFLLDIDVFTKVPFPAKGERLSAVLADMRTEKNEIFEDCLTDKTRELFGGVEE